MKRSSCNARRSKSLRLFVVTALSLAATPASAWDVPPDSREVVELRNLYTKYRCPVADRLQRLHDAGDPAKDRNRYLVIAPRRPMLGYVQCRFHDHETTMLCEADSGFYDDKPGTPRSRRLPKDAIDALGRLGFSTDESAGNFVLETNVATPPDVRSIADLMRHALHGGYGVQDTSPLEFNAPFAPGLGCDSVG